MSRALSWWQAIVLGLVVLLAIGLGVTGLFAVGSRGWFGENALHVRVGFEEIHGVSPGTRVRIRGIDAGEVKKIHAPVDPGAPIVLDLLIKGKYRHLVRTNSRVRIVDEGMLGAKALEVRPGKGEAPEAKDNALLGSDPSGGLAADVNRLSDKVLGALEGKGTVGKLIHDPQLYNSAVTGLDRFTKLMGSAQRTTDAAKELPWVGGYIKDPKTLLFRPGYARNAKHFREKQLFTPGKAVLTEEGKKRLDSEVAPWLNSLKHTGSEVVVVSYADPDKTSVDLADLLTRRQSEAVVEYLKNKHSVQKMGWFSFSRKVIALGMGLRPPPDEKPAPIPPPRTEVLVFVPQGK